MKRLFKFALAVSAFFLLGSVSTYAQKFGYIDLNELIEAMPEMNDVRTKFEAFQNDLNDQYETMTVEFNNKWNDYSTNIETMSEAIRQIREEELSNIRDRITQFEQNAQGLMYQERSNLMAPVIEKAQEAVQKVCKANQFTAVFELSAQPLAYYDENTMVNVLPLVQQELGI
ncbi:MAG: OmpH family outer membrane protein [Rikenellaceae bacterium]|nr:OmpH family outer membrane protein [Rikenellaceae bacterium]